MDELVKFQTQLGVKFKNKNILKNVFVHRSYLNENSKFKLPNNERLEFLGDAVLEFIVTKHLFDKYKNPEGELTNWRSALVNGKMLSIIASDLGLGKLLLLSKGEEKSGGRVRQLLLANTFEALIGAIYLDQGMEATEKFIKKYLLSKLDEIITNKLYLDPKSHLQELIQEKLGITPTYEVITESGPDHDKIFKVAVCADNKKLGSGSGKSKQAAQTDAATAALKEIKI